MLDGVLPFFFFFPASSAETTLFPLMLETIFVHNLKTTAFLCEVVEVASFIGAKLSSEGLAVRLAWACLIVACKAA